MILKNLAKITHAKTLMHIFVDWKKQQGQIDKCAERPNGLLPTWPLLLYL